MGENGKSWQAGTEWSEGREDEYMTFLPTGKRSPRQERTIGNSRWIGGAGPPSPNRSPQHPSGRFLCSTLVRTLLDHGRNCDREFKRGVERVPVVTRYLFPAACAPSYLTSFLRVGRVRCQVGTHRFHGPPPVRHFRTALARLRSIV